jgi:programmed cell death 8 (apoptosis-inducing factor)
VQTSDYRRLDAVTRDKKTKTMVVVGGGFLGSEMAVALAHRGKAQGMKVVQVFPEEGACSVVYCT